MHHFELEGNITPGAVFAKIERNYGALPSTKSTKLYTVICQTGHSPGAKKLINADILLFQLIFWTETFLTST